MDKRLITIILTFSRFCYFFRDTKLSFFGIAFEFHRKFEILEKGKLTKSVKKTSKK